MRILVYSLKFRTGADGDERPYTGKTVARLASRGHEVIVVTGLSHYPGWRVPSPYDGGVVAEVSDATCRIGLSNLKMHRPFTSWETRI